MTARLGLGLVLAGCFGALAPALIHAQEAVATATPTSSNLSSSSPKLAPLTVIVELIGNTKITGTLTDVAQLPLKSAFGEASVPMAEIAGVKMASTDDTSTTVILKNGDSITGATDLKVITVDTEWGSAKINGSSIISMLMVPDLKWSATMGLNGKRWSLVDAKTVTPPPGAAVGISSSPSTRPQPNTPVFGSPLTK